MTSAACSLAEQYTVALQEYLERSSETALSRAYELGRAALGNGMGVLDIATIYRDAVHAAALRDETSQAGFSRAAEFFFESLAPFEMTFRGYGEANQQLHALNRALAAQNAELRHAKAMADAANQELESFSYSVAHDLRAPLRHIDGFSQMLIAGWSHALDDQGQEYLGRVRTAAQRMAELIEDLLRLSRVTRSDLQRRPVDLSTLARAVATELDRAAPERQVRCVIEEGLVAEGDPHLLRVVFDNLLGNAWKFTGKTAQPVVEVGCVVKDGQRTYFVRDNGAGFDPAYAGRLFTPFQRLHRDTDFPGTGIGLATVQRIVRRHGGQIWTESTAGRGATFFWTLGPC